MEKLPQDAVGRLARIYGLSRAPKHLTLKLKEYKAQELCKSRVGRPVLTVPISPDRLCRRNATLNLNLKRTELRGLAETIRLSDR